MTSDGQADPVLEERLDRVILTLEGGGAYGLVSTGAVSEWFASVFEPTGDRWYPVLIRFDGMNVGSERISEERLRDLVDKHGEVDWSQEPPRQVRLAWADEQVQLYRDADRPIIPDDR